MVVGVTRAARSTMRSMQQCLPSAETRGFDAKSLVPRINGVHASRSAASMDSTVLVKTMSSVGLLEVCGAIAKNARPCSCPFKSKLKSEASPVVRFTIF